jgi:hypothetical protein
MSIRVGKSEPVIMVFFDLGEAGDALGDDGEARSGPSLVLQDDGCGHWAGHMLLPSWSGLIKRPDNKVKVDVMHKEYPLVDGPPSPQHLQAFEWLTRNGAVMMKAVLDAIMAKYPGLQARYNYSPEEAAVVMPTLREAKDLTPLIELINVYVYEAIDDEGPHIGLLLGCTWDEEHSLGVMIHGFRLLLIGEADCAFSGWPTEQDAEQPRDSAAVPQR